MRSSEIAWYWWRRVVDVSGGGTPQLRSSFDDRVLGGIRTNVPGGDTPQLCSSTLCCSLSLSLNAPHIRSRRIRSASAGWITKFDAAMRRNSLKRNRYRWRVTSFKVARNRA